MGIQYTELQVAQGKVLIYHLFDIADMIDLEKLRHKWAGRSTNIRLVSRRTSPTYLQFEKEPLLLPLGQRDLMLTKERRLSAEVRAKAFDFGVVSICWEVPFPRHWPTLVKEADLYIDSDQVAAQSRQVLDDLRPALEASLSQPYAQILVEDYTIFYVHRFAEHLLAEQLLELASGDIASMIRGESKRLSASERQNVLEQRLSYFEDDLAVIAWNSSFIYDPEGSSEHVDILEFANSELLELRSYDSLLDRQLQKIYDGLEDLPQKRFFTLFRNPYQQTSQKLLSLLIDVAELTDRLENTLKIIGDLYCARVYQRISSVLRLQEWQARVDGKLNSAHQIYSTLNSEISDRRSILLEVTIVLLITFELVLFFFPFKGH